MPCQIVHKGDTHLAFLPVFWGALQEKTIKKNYRRFSDKKKVPYSIPYSLSRNIWEKEAQDKVGQWDLR